MAEEGQKRVDQEDQQERKTWKKGFGAGVAVCILLMAIFCFFSRPSALTVLKKGGLSQSQAEQLVNKVDQLMRTLEDNYLEDLDENALLDGAYSGMVQAVGDQYTRYYTEEQYIDHRNASKGQYVGIGITVRKSEAGGAEVVSVEEKGPAAAAGVQQGDVLVRVEGTDVTDKELTDIVALIKGEQGTEVEVTFERQQQTLTVKVLRETIDETTVKSEMLEDGIGYIAISGFEEVTTEQFQSALNSLKEQELQGLIVDLRDNLGGRVDVVQEITNELLPAGIITYTEDKYGNREVYDSTDDPYLNLPLALLVNGNSASASEIMAGAIQDREAGILVGTTTYGKGIVQKTIPFSDGTAVKVTMAKYYTPNGNYIHKIGIEPDIVIDLPAGVTFGSLKSHDEDVQLQTALEALKTKMGR